MTLFINIPQAPGLDYEAFKADYLATTGEKIQENPLENEQGTHYLAGSFRLTQEQADGLVSRHAGVTIANTMPVGWATKEVTE